MTALASFWASPVHADHYRDGHFSFDVDGVSSNDVASTVVGNLLIQGIAEGVKPVVGRWPSVPCYKGIDLDTATLRQLSDLLGALKQRLGLNIAACTRSSPSAITYYFGRGQISTDEKRNILELVRPVQESNARLSDFLHERTVCYWHAHLANVGGLFEITNATVLVNLQLLDADQMARCLFIGTAGSLGLTHVVPAHEESVPVNWAAAVETDLLSLFVLYNLKDEVVAGDSRAITTATEAVISAMHDVGSQSSPESPPFSTSP
jgi:hypothetical protein